MHLRPARFLLRMFFISVGFFAHCLRKRQVKMIYTIAFFVVAVPIAVHCAVDCGELNPCYPPDFQELYEDIEGFPDEEVFKKYCRPSMDYLTCRKNYYSNCLEPDPTGINESTYDDILQLTSLLCEETSELRKDYMENVKCYNEAFETIDNCVENITILEMSFRTNLKHQLDGPGATPKAVTCMLLPSLKNCALRGMEEQCGKGGAKSLEEIASRFVAIITDIQCPVNEMKNWEDRLNTFLERNDSQLLN